MTTQLTVDQLRWKLAGAKKLCPAVHSSLDGACGEHLCNGTRQVYVLPDTVREPCNSSVVYDDMERRRHFHEGVGWADDCLGYTPSDSLEVWEQAVFTVWPQAHLTRQHGVTFLMADCAFGKETAQATGKLFEALLRALDAVLEAQASEVRS